MYAARGLKDLGQRSVAPLKLRMTYCRDVGEPESVEKFGGPTDRWNVFGLRETSCA